METDPATATPMELAFETWVDAFRGPLVGLLASWGSDWATAEELAGDPFAEAWMGREPFQGDPGDLGAVGAWLRGIAHHLWKASLRKRRRDRIVPGPTPQVAGVDGPAVDGGAAFGGLPPAESEQEVQRRASLKVAFDQLKPQHQNILRMYYLEETATADVAALLGLTTRAVEGRLYQARRSLRLKVERMANKEARV